MKTITLNGTIRGPLHELLKNECLLCYSPLIRFASTTNRFEYSCGSCAITNFIGVKANEEPCDHDTIKITIDDSIICMQRVVVQAVEYRTRRATISKAAQAMYDHYQKLSAELRAADIAIDW